MTSNSSSSSMAVQRSSRLSVPLGTPDNAHYHSQSKYPQIMKSKGQGQALQVTTLSAGQYLSRAVDVTQMDIQAALEQMKSLLCLTSPPQLQKVYKLAYYRKKTKGHYARDDPAFISLQIILIAIASLAFTIAFRSDTFLYTLFYFLFQSIVVNYVIAGIVIATVTRTIAHTHCWNTNHMNMNTNNYNNNNTNNNTGSQAHSKDLNMPFQNNNNNNNNTSSNINSPDAVEWMYAFDIHANSYFPLFIILYVLQYPLLQLLLTNTFFAFFLSNLLYTIAFTYYFYITHLGYRMYKPDLINTQVFLFPIALVVFVFILNLVGYPFGLGWNASRIMAHLYFEQ